MNLTPKTYLAFGLALAVQIIASATWYASQPHLTPLSRYLPDIWYLFCGFLVGLLDNQGYLRKTLVLGVLLSVITAIIHWTASQLGVPVDLGTASSSAVLAIIAMPICIALSMLGGTLGSLVYRLVIHRKRFGSK